MPYVARKKNQIETFDFMNSYDSWTFPRFKKKLADLYGGEWNLAVHLTML